VKLMDLSNNALKDVSGSIDDDTVKPITTHMAGGVGGFVEGGPFFFDGTDVYKIETSGVIEKIGVIENSAIGDKVVSYSTTSDGGLIIGLANEGDTAFRIVKMIPVVEAKLGKMSKRGYFAR